MSGKFMTGAMTYSFIQAITKKQTITYGELMHSIHEAIKGANSKSSCLTFRRSKLLQVMIPIRYIGICLFYESQHEIFVRCSNVLKMGCFAGTDVVFVGDFRR